MIWKIKKKNIYTPEFVAMFITWFMSVYAYLRAPDQVRDGLRDTVVAGRAVVLTPLIQ